MYFLPNSSLLLVLASLFIYNVRCGVFIYKDSVHSSLPRPAESNVCMTTKCVVSAADFLRSLDETVEPCDDFYRFACGGWLKRNELSEDQPQLHIFSQAQDNLNRKLKEILETDYEISEPLFVKNLKDFYSTCADVDSIEKKGSEPLKIMLSRLGGWPVIEGNEWNESTFDWVDSLISLQKHGYDHNIFLTSKVEDFELSEFDMEGISTIFVREPEMKLLAGANLTLGLGDPEIAEFFKLMKKAAKLLGADESLTEKELLEILNFTITLESYMIPDSLPAKDKFEFGTIKMIQTYIPQIPWLKYITGVFNDYENIIVIIENMHYVRYLADLIMSTEKRVIANYMMIRVVFESAEFLSEEWKSVYEYMMKKTPDDYGNLRKQFKIEKVRWKRCLSSVEKEMTIALGSYYVRRYFNEETKDEATIFLKYVHKEFLKILEETDWMHETTKRMAKEKANAIDSYIGYPKELLNDTFMMKIYENLTITTDSYLENVMALHKMAMDTDSLTLGKRIDHKSKFKYRSITNVNALYATYLNSILIPASILSDAFYEKDRPNYVNFGAIGYVIGHEITHGFDNKGRHFDKDGKFHNWWDKKSDEHFNKKAKCIIDQYNNYTTDIGMKINGEKTQGENIADNGGLKEAYWAYNSWVKDNGIEPTLPGLNYTQNQLFWISAAHVWCSKYEAETLKEKLLTDNHSPGRYRVIGPMSNLEEFSKDFKCSADSPMNRKYKCKVW